MGAASPALAAAIGAAGTGGKILGGIKSAGDVINKASPILGAAGAGIGAASQASAQNRGEQFAGQQDLAQLIMQREMGKAQLEGQADRDVFDQSIRREQEGRDGRADAWRKLQSAQRTLSPGARPQLSPYSVAPRQATDTERQGAEALSAEVMARLQGGNPIAAPTRRDVNISAPNVDPGLLKAGGMEKAGGILAPILAYLSRGGVVGPRSQEATHQTPPWMMSLV